MTKHTPGPWIALDLHFGSQWLVQADRKRGSQNIGRIIAHVANKAGQDAGEEEAGNARLIASAPALFDASKALLEFWDNGTPVHPGAEVVADLRKAVAQAQEE
ncbi:MAG: hypothetical protein KGL39_30940 [Patescibacteria group bacterium]|nr:hypothetical protein [Patescibacteria group bacterium]